MIKKDLLKKSAVLAPVILATWFVTSAIMGNFKAQAHDRRPAKKSHLPVAPDGSLIPTGEPEPAVEADASATPRTARGSMLISMLMMHTMDASVQGQQVSVAASARMEDVRRNKVYMWKLEVYSDGEEAPSLSMPYAEQAFEIHPSGLMSPTFSETFQLPPGKYRVSVSLHTFPAGATFEDLKTYTDPAAVGSEKTIEIH